MTYQDTRAAGRRTGHPAPYGGRPAAPVPPGRPAPPDPAAGVPSPPVFWLA
ncbi:oxidoreductase, partial [Micromonospora provocatoris]